MDASSRRYYETNAAEYFKRTHGRTLEVYWSMLDRRLGSGSMILDIGCGSGRDLKHFREAGFTAIGIDFALPLLKLAADFSHQRVVLGNLVALPFAGETFDAAWALASLLHIHRVQIDHVLLNIYRCLKPEAYFFAAVKAGSGQETDSNDRLNTYYSMDEWCDVLERCGFRPIETNTTSERRLSDDGSWQEIPWIGCLARRTKAVR
jgi:SAM-dependent methyltransferase